MQAQHILQKPQQQISSGIHIQIFQNTLIEENPSNQIRDPTIIQVLGTTDLSTQHQFGPSSTPIPVSRNTVNHTTPEIARLTDKDKTLKPRSQNPQIWEPFWSLAEIIGPHREGPKPVKPHPREKPHRSSKARNWARTKVESEKLVPCPMVSCLWV